MEGIDQLSVSCLVCGHKVPFDRSSDRPQQLFCSEKCKEIMQEAMGFRTKDDIFKCRAAEANICVTCGGILTNKARSDSLYCSPRCQKRARRLGIRADGLARIRLSAIAGTGSAGKRNRKKDLDAASREGRDG